MSKDDPEYEFSRGWEGGYRQAVRDALTMLVQGKETEMSEDFPNNLILLKIPKENIVQLQAELEKELRYP